MVYEYCDHIEPAAFTIVLYSTRRVESSRFTLSFCTHTYQASHTSVAHIVLVSSPLASLTIALHSAFCRISISISPCRSRRRAGGASSRWMQVATL